MTVTDKAAWDETVVDTPAWDETVVDQQAYDEQVLVQNAWDETTYKTVGHAICDGCGQDLAGMPQDQIEAHIEAHLLAGEKASYYTTSEQVPTTVHHDAVYQTVHHDAVTHVVHHDAVTHTVHHDAVTHTEKKWVAG